MNTFFWSDISPSRAQRGMGEYQIKLNFSIFQKTHIFVSFCSFLFISVHFCSFFAAFCHFSPVFAKSLKKSSTIRLLWGPLLDVLCYPRSLFQKFTRMKCSDARSLPIKSFHKSGAVFLSIAQMPVYYFYIVRVSFSKIGCAAWSYRLRPPASHSHPKGGGSVTTRWQFGDNSVTERWQPGDSMVTFLRLTVTVRWQYRVNRTNVLHVTV